MFISRLSPSSFKAHEGCEHAYFIGNNLKYRFPPGIAAQKGTAAHRALEILALLKLARQNGESKIELKKEISIDAELPEIFSYIEENENLTKCFNAKEIEEYHKCSHIALEMQNGYYDVRNREIIAPEKRVQIPIDKEWVGEDGLILSGIIDLVTKVDEDTYEIIDYKTGGQLKDFATGKEINYENLLNDIQLRMYHLAASEIYGPDKNYIVSIVFIKLEQSFSIAFTPADIPETLNMIKEKYTEIKECVEPKRNQSWKCTKFCDYGKHIASKIGLKNEKQFASGGIAKIGDSMTICDLIHKEIREKGIEWVEINLKK